MMMMMKLFQVREQLRLVWAAESGLLSALYPTFREPLLPPLEARRRAREGKAAIGEAATPAGIEKLFIQALLVPASKFRPIRFMAGDKFDHPQTGNFKRLMEEIQLVKAILQVQCPFLIHP